MSKLFLQKHLNVMELKKNDVSRDRDLCYFFFLFSTGVLIFSLSLSRILGFPCSSFFYDSVGSSLSIQSFFFFFTNGPSFSAILPFSFPLHLHRVLLRRRSGSVVRSFWSLLVVSASGTNLSSPRRADQRSCSYKKRLFVVLLL